MFVPFLGALLVAGLVIAGKEKLAGWIWSALLLIVLATFWYHVSKPLQLMF